MKDLYLGRGWLIKDRGYAYNVDLERTGIPKDKEEIKKLMGQTFQTPRGEKKVIGVDYWHALTHPLTNTIGVLFEI